MRDSDVMELSEENKKYLVKVATSFLGDPNLSEEIKEQRQTYDNDFFRLCTYWNVNPENDIEKQFETKGYRLEKLFANVPYQDSEGPMLLEDEYNERWAMDEFKGVRVVPAWWMPSVMRSLRIKDMLPFAVYVR